MRMAAFLHVYDCARHLYVHSQSNSLLCLCLLCSKHLISLGCCILGEHREHEESEAPSDNSDWGEVLPSYKGKTPHDITSSMRGVSQRIVGHH